MNTPMRRMRAAYCARAVTGQATAAPPNAASNSRRPMVTAIRPSRARCVKGTIPRHERAVPNRAASGTTWRTPGTPERPLHFLSNLRDNVDARGFL